MADKLYFSRDAKLYVELTDIDGDFQGLWEIPVLDGFSFSQSTNQSEIGLNEMESTAGISRRGRRLFTDSLAPAEWSFSTYVRPTNRGSSKMHLVDQVLWAAMAGADEFGGTGVTNTTTTLEGDYTRSTNPVNGVGGTSGLVYDELGASLPSDNTAVGGLLGFQNSNRSTLPQMTLYFVFETDPNEPMVYKLSNSIVNECSIDFDIDGIATANWSGFAKEVEDLKSLGLVAVGTTEPSVVQDKVWLNSGSDLKLYVPVDSGGKPSGSAAVHDAYYPAISSGVTSTNNFIRNRLTQLSVRGRNPDVMEGKPVTLTNVSNASSAVITVGSGHGVVVGDTISFSGIVDDNTSTNNTLQAALNGINHTVTAVTSTSITISTDTSSLDGYSSGGIVHTGIYTFTLTGGNITISNNVTYLVPEELGTINKPVEGVTGSRAIGGNFTCYLVFDDTGNDGDNTGSSADFFSDLVNPTKGLTKVVNDFDVTFKVGGTVSGQPRLNLNFPKVHIDVPTHSIEDVIALETNFGAYTNDFNTVDEFNMEVFGVTA
jgi:hypothetical protein